MFCVRHNIGPYNRTTYQEAIKAKTIHLATLLVTLGNVAGYTWQRCWLHLATLLVSHLHSLAGFLSYLLLAANLRITTDFP